MPHGRWLLLCLFLSLGCARGADEPTPKPPLLSLPTGTFDPATAGSVKGRVDWEGDLPEIPPFEIRTKSFKEPSSRFQKPNPNAPRISPDTRGVAGAVVFIKGVDSAKSRIWNHAPVRVEQRDLQIVIRQGDHEGNVGFVSRGDHIELVSRDPKSQALSASGAAFFTLTFPDPDHLRRRQLADKGLVELTSARGHYWMRGYLFVDEHPYYALTDSDGRFELTGVPAGKYQLVCWMPNWHTAKSDRDPESGLITRLTFRPPVERVQTVTITPGGEISNEFHLNLSHFVPRP